MPRPIKCHPFTKPHCYYMLSSSFFFFLSRQQQLKDEIAEVTAEMESVDNGEERYDFAHCTCSCCVRRNSFGDNNRAGFLISCIVLWLWHLAILWPLSHFCSCFALVVVIVVS